jgi:hypothetical protein
MYDAVSIYHVMKAEQQAMLAELAEIERIRSLPRRISSRPRRPANAVLRIPWLSKVSRADRIARLAD